jgi:hypothetical protein
MHHAEVSRPPYSGDTINTARSYLTKSAPTMPTTALLDASQKRGDVCRAVGATPRRSEHYMMSHEVAESLRIALEASKRAQNQSPGANFMCAPALRRRRCTSRRTPSAHFERERRASTRRYDSLPRHHRDSHRINKALGFDPNECGLLSARASPS